MLLLKMERQRRGWTQTQLSMFTGIASPTISAIETERLRPGPTQRHKIARVFGLPEDRLFGRVPDDVLQGDA